MSKPDADYRGILKATSIIGGSAFVNILISMVRAKVVAVLLGPVGFGMLGMYTSLVSLITTISGSGIGMSGVRQIAEAHGTGDQKKVSRTVSILRKTVWGTGILGTCLVILLSPLLAYWSFEDHSYTLPIVFLSITVLLTNISLGQTCIIQGTRRLKDLAKINILGGINATVIGIPCYFFWGIHGIVPALVIGGMATLVTSWYFARKIPVEKVDSNFREDRKQIYDLLQFGFPVMLTGVISGLSAYLIRVMLIRMVTLDGVGLYQAAFALSGVLVNFVLSAMGTDYYPRLTAIASDNEQLGKEVNAQTLIALFLAVPALAATIIFAPLGMKILYTAKFSVAADILRWSVFGVFGRVISWPLGYVILAKGRGKTYFYTELLANIAIFVLTLICTKKWGLVGTGIAFPIAYFFYTVIVYTVFYQLSGKKWSDSVIYHVIAFLLLLILVGFAAILKINMIFYWVINLSLLILISTYCMFQLSNKIGISMDSIKRKLFKNGR